MYCRIVAIPTKRLRTWKHATDRKRAMENRRKAHKFISPEGVHAGRRWIRYCGIYIEAANRQNAIIAAGKSLWFKHRQCILMFLAACYWYFLDAGSRMRQQPQNCCAPNVLANSSIMEWWWWVQQSWTQHNSEGAVWCSCMLLIVDVCLRCHVWGRQLLCLYLTLYLSVWRSSWGEWGCFEKQLPRAQPLPNFPEMYPHHSEWFVPNTSLVTPF